MKLTFKSCNLCFKIKLSKVKLSALSAMIFLTKRKYHKLNLKRKKINLKTSCPELHMTWKDSFNIQNKNKQLRNSLKSKILKKITLTKLFF